MVVDGLVVPMELAHLPYRKGTFEDYVGEQALQRDGRRKWRKRVADVVARLTAALVPDDVVLGGGNARLLKTLPPLPPRRQRQCLHRRLPFVGGRRQRARAPRQGAIK